MDEGVYNYVMDNETARQFAQKLEDMVEFLIPNYAKEGKTSLVIAIGCTGGKHWQGFCITDWWRSVNMEYGWNTEISVRTLF